jgi:glycosyltransferase involved in cell wall biosynthesis
MRSSRPLIVVPAWNEEASIARVITSLVENGYEVVVVSDGSTDSTASIARSCGARVVELPVNLGVGGALRAGFRYAVDHGYDAVVQCDADGQHLAEEIAVLLDARTRSGAHLVIGSRFAKNGNYETSFFRKVAMNILAFIARRSTGTYLSDVSSGFRVISEPLLSEFAREFPSAYLGDTFEAVISAGRAGYTIEEIPVSMKQREHGTSTASTLSAIKFLVRVLLIVLLRIEVKIQPPRDENANILG